MTRQNINHSTVKIHNVSVREYGKFPNFNDKAH